MLDALRRLTLRVLRVPPEPQPPTGAPGSVRVFRAGQNFFRLKVGGWIVGQTVALAGALISLWFFGGLIDRTWRMKETAKASPPAVAVPANPSAPTDASRAGAETPAAGVAEPPAPKTKGKRTNSNSTRQLAQRTPDWVFIALQLLEYGAFALYLFQIPWTFAALRLDYEMRWYIVTDRSLRIRSGLLSVQESTLSFVNIQQVVVTQGPLQRLLKLADVRVQSAGGGAGDPHGKGGGDTLHTAVFQAVDNAHEIRDLVLARLRQFRAAGLGDTEDAVHHAANVSAPPADQGDAIGAAQEMLAEARALRSALAR